MRRTSVLTGVAAGLLLALAARADVLKLAPRGELVGTLQEVTFRAKGVQSTFPMEEVAAIELAKEGKEGGDKLELDGGITLNGQLVSVSLKMTEGVTAVARDKLASVTVDQATTVEAIEAKRADDEVNAEPEENLTAEQKQALEKNKELFKTYMTKIDETKKEGFEKVKTKYTKQVKRLVDDVVQLEKQIEQKRRRRQDAWSRGGSHSTGSSRYGNSQYTSEYERLLNTDGLEKDERELAKKKRDASKLKKTIRGEEKEAREDAETREKRVLYVAKDNKKKIVGGEVLSEEQMTARYEAAVAVKGGADPKDSKGKSGKK